MSNISNTMVITDSSLSQISRELIDKRVYKEGLVSTSGNPIILNGIASNFSATNRVFADFTPITPTKKLVLKTKGVYSSVPNTANGAKVLGSLVGSNSSPAIDVYNNRIEAMRFTSSAGASARISGLNLKDGDVIEVEVIVTTTLVTLNAKINETLYTNTWLGNGLYCGAIRGWYATIPGNWYWTGSIDLAACALYIDDDLIFTPSAKNSFKFTKIIVADSNYALTDVSTPVLHHVYECSVTEISKTENNVLLTATIPEDAYLNIAQLGLYYEDDIGIHIFSIIEGLTIKKTNDLVYNLVIHVKLDINVVNTVAMPEIVVKDKPYTNFSKFLTIKQVYAYITENLERIIKTNALGIGNYTSGAMTESKPVGVGYNRAQVYYRLQNDLSLWEDNFVATNDYAKVRAKFTPYITTSFNPEHIIQEGDVYLSDDGILSVFSNYNYGFTTNLPLNNNSNWKFTTTFTTGGNVTTKQSVITFSSETVGQPLTLGIENNKCTLRIDAEDEALVSDSVNVHLFARNRKITLNNIDYYSWVTNEEITNRTILTTAYTGITNSTPVYNETGELLSGWHFNQQVNSTIINNTQLFNVSPLTEYKVTVEYNNEIYNVSYKVGNTEHSNIYTIASSKPLNIISRTLFGVGYNGSYPSNPFYGQINLYNTNLETSSYINGTVTNRLYNFLNEEVYNKSVLDYFHLPVYAHSYFHVKNLGMENSSYLEEYEGAFRGYYDRVYFDNPKGFTLCTKVHLHDEKDKILLAKGNVESNEYYFILEQVNNSLKFSLYLNDATVVLSKEFTLQTIRSFIEHPVNITVTCDGNQYSPTFKMYRNNELLDTSVLPVNSTRNVSDMYLMNHEVLTENDDLEVHTVYDIIDFEGELNTTEIYYINNILDTNF